MSYAADRGCRDRMLQTFQREREVYRAVQYGLDRSPMEGGGFFPPGPPVKGVLETENVRTTDLVPYLVHNYRGFDCRLRSVCEAIERSIGHLGGAPSPLPPSRPLGCGRLLASGVPFEDQPIPECSFSILQERSVSRSLPPESLLIPEECRALSSQILLEEREMLRLLAAQDSAERGTQRAITTVRSTLEALQRGFLEPLRDLVNFMGSVLHPIPCYLTHCG